MDTAVVSAINLRPLNDRIVVLPDEREEQTKGGVFLPDTHEGDREEPQRGRVLAVGRGRWVNGERTPIDVHVGEIVRFTRIGGSSITVEGTKYLILKETDLLCVEF